MQISKLIPSFLKSRRAHPSSTSESVWRQIFGGGASTETGIYVDDTTAMGSSAVLCAQRNLIESVGMLPHHLYKLSDTKLRRRERATDNPLYKVLHDCPNPELTPFEFKSWMMSSMLNSTGFFAEIERNKAGNVIALWPLHSRDVAVKRIDKKLCYEIAKAEGGSVTLDAGRILHVRGFYRGGLVGMSLVEMGKEAIGLGVAAEKYASRFFKNNAVPLGYIKHPGSLTPDAEATVATTIREAQEGLTKAHRLFVLDEGMSWEQTGVHPEDAQLLQSRTFQILEVCRIFHIPPHRLFELSHATFSNIEHQGMEYVTYTLMPWLIRIEQRFDQSLLTPKERETYYSKFLVDALLRGDLKSRYEAYSVGKNNGWLCGDDIRDLEEMNPLPGGQGQVYTVPLNMQSAAALASGKTEANPAHDGDSGTRLIEHRADSNAQGERLRRAAFRIRLREAWAAPMQREYKRIVRAEIREVRKIFKKHLSGERAMEDITPDLTAALEKYYRDPDGMPAHIKKILGPVFSEYAKAMSAAAAEEIGQDDAPDLSEFTNDYLDASAKRYGGTHMAELFALIRDTESDPADAVDERLDKWEETEATEIANEERIRLGEAVAKAAMVFLGVTRFIWVANGSACPLCAELNGQVVGVEKSFLEPGDTVNGDETTGTITVQSRIGHAPLHKGCQCVVSAE